MRTLTKEINIINEGAIQFPILPNGSGWKSTEKEKLSVIESGEGKVLFSKIIKAVDSAKKIICLQSFLIQESEIIDALISAQERRVKIFVLSSAEARLDEKIEEEEDFIRKDYIKLLDGKFKNHFVHRSAENFHGKYILIDPTTNPKGFLCTNNFTLNGFTKNPELTVELNIEQCEDLFKVFVYHFWEHSTDEQTATNEFAKVKPTSKFSLPKLVNILLTSPQTKSNTLNKTLIEAVGKANKSISFSTFQLDKNIELIKAIIEKAKQNVLVTLFCRPIERQFNEQLKELLEVGVQIYFHPLIHAKSMLIDNKYGFVFTANLISRGLENGLEVGIELSVEQTNDLAIIHKSWQYSFPTRATKVANVKDLKEIQIFKERKLTTKLLLDESKVESRKIVKVADLFFFFNQKFEIKDSLIKTLKVKLTAEIEALPMKYNANNAEKFEVIETEEQKGKKSKIVVIKKSFDINDLYKLENVKDCRIYSI